MIASRRTGSNFALDRAVEWCRDLDKPLVVLEALTSTYEWACERFHAFVLDGMADNSERLAATPAAYYPYVESHPRAGRGLIRALGRRACVVVTDDYPCFFLPALVARTAKRLEVRLEAVDSNGLLPMAVAEKAFGAAHSFRRFLQQELPHHWDAFPRQDPLRALPAERRARIPSDVLSRWPRTSVKRLRKSAALLAELPIDHAVPATEMSGGAVAARRAMQRFVRQRLEVYDEARNQPEVEATSGLSPYLHFGHISAHDVFRAVARHQDWSPDRAAEKPSGARAGWWGMSAAGEAFLDQLITWRELGFNMCHRRTDYDRFESLPEWARATLQKHWTDPREFVYTLEQLDTAQTHDTLWNAAQMQLRREGTIHNYLRMLWGKQILAWSPRPWDALDMLIELNNKYALDGRDPNSYSGVFWCLGRYDRPWGPEREVFGTIRYMTSKNTARKYRVTSYLERYANEALRKPGMRT
jgi:deoxyribodipyrimidine photo-lyase